MIWINKERGLKKFTDLQISVKDASTMAVVNSINKLLKILPCFILLESSIMSLEIKVAIKQIFICRQIQDPLRKRAKEGIGKTYQREKYIIGIKKKSNLLFCQIVLPHQPIPGQCKSLIYLPSPTRKHSAYID